MVTDDENSGTQEEEQKEKQEYIGKRTGKPIRGLLSGTGFSTDDFIEEKRRKHEKRKQQLGIRNNE